MSKHKLKSGQINFENQDHPGAFSCVVIKNGVFHNITDEFKDVLIKALQEPEKEIISIDDMF